MENGWLKKLYGQQPDHKPWSVKEQLSRSQIDNYEKEVHCLPFKLGSTWKSNLKPADKDDMVLNDITTKQRTELPGIIQYVLAKKICCWDK